jgi:hypothetical protein
LSEFLQCLHEKRGGAKKRKKEGRGDFPERNGKIKPFFFSLCRAVWKGSPKGGPLFVWLEFIQRVQKVSGWFTPGHVNAWSVLFLATILPL